MMKKNKKNNFFKEYKKSLIDLNIKLLIFYIINYMKKCIFMIISNSFIYSYISFFKSFRIF
jgi:hypothetical protein